jgi:PAS domain S-box-containing protein
MTNPPRQPQDASRPVRVLIGDDDSSVRHLLRRFLEHDCGALTDDVPDGPQVLDRLTKGAYDLVLLDLQMPEMDGAETLAAIRRSPRYGQQKVIILTGRNDERMVRDVVALGVTDFIAKPLALKVLRARLGPHVTRDVSGEADRDAGAAPPAAAPPEVQTPAPAEPPAAAATGDTAADVLAAAASERLDRAVLDALPHAVWLIGRDGMALHLNRRALELIGRTADTVGGTEWLALVHPDDAEELRIRWLAAVRAEAPFGIEFRLRRPDGRYRWCRSEGAPLRNAKGLADRWVGTWTDVDDLRRMQRGLERDTRVLELVTDAVVICDLDGMVTYWGPGAERLLQWTGGEMLDRHVLERFPARIATELQARLDAVRNGTAWTGELEDYTKDGARVWTSVQVVLHRHSGRRDSLIWVQQDLSAQRRAEAALRRAEAEAQHLLARERSRGGWLRRTGTESGGAGE